MAEEEVKKIAKPKMQGLLIAQAKRNIFFAIISSIVGGFLFKTLYMDARKRRYAEFYKNYDIDKEFHRMRRKGLFDSCDQFVEGDDEKDE